MAWGFGSYKTQVTSACQWYSIDRYETEISSFPLDFRLWLGLISDIFSVVYSPWNSDLWPVTCDLLFVAATWAKVIS